MDSIRNQNRIFKNIETNEKGNNIPKLIECNMLLLLLLLHVMSDSVRPHRRQPTRLPRPWDSPGKNIGVGCHCLLQCMKVKSEREVAQSCPTLHDPMDCSLPGSSLSMGLSRQECWSRLPLPSLKTHVMC